MKKNIIIVGKQGAGKSTKMREIVGNNPYRYIQNPLSFDGNMAIGVAFLVFEEARIMEYKFRESIKKLVNSSFIKTPFGRKRIIPPIIICHTGTIGELPTFFKSRRFEIIEVGK